MNKYSINLKYIEQNRETIQNILSGVDKRLLVIVGPCSIHSYKEAIEYAKLLINEQEKYKDSLFFVMRTYFQKPRTTIGWEGLSVDPDLNETYNHTKGVELCQKICEEITKLEIPIADEALNMELTDKWSKYLCYAALGARNSEDQNMRKYCSNLNSPVGVKHPRSGDLEDGVNGVLSVQHSNHKLFYKKSLIQCKGNEFAHLILRGSKQGSNLNDESVKKVQELYNKHNISNPAIICDLSHDNSVNENGKKSAQNQITNAQIVKELQQTFPQLIRGVMIESHINYGKQKMQSMKKLEEGVSITDECISFEQTQEIFEILSENNKIKN